MGDDLIDKLQESLRVAREAKRLAILKNPSAPARTVSSRLNDAIDSAVRKSDLERRERPGKHIDHVYCLRFGDGPIKFGYSQNIGARVSVIGASHWAPLTMLGAIIGGRAVETAIHDALSPWRISGTEWFQPEPPVLELAAMMTSGRKLPAEVQKSVDLYREMPIEHIYAGTRGQGRCPVCGQ